MILMILFLNNTPISFCHKNNINLKFVNSDSEDFIFVNSLKKLGTKICISLFVSYYVKQIKPINPVPKFNRVYLHH